MVVALLAWWEEDPAWLTRCVNGVSRFADHLIAADGAYENMQGAYDSPMSAGYQADAILAAAGNMGITLHRQRDPWVGDQVAKRTFMFRLADLVCQPGDWLFVIDADEIVTDVPADLEAQLADAAEEGFEACTVEQSDLPDRGVQPSRRFYRYDPSLRVEGAHYRFVAGTNGNRRLLRGDEHVETIVPAYQVQGFRFEHWSGMRTPHRRELQRTYYRRRHDHQLEQ